MAGIACVSVKCNDIKCQGEIDFKKAVSIQTGCNSLSAGYPCKDCGLLHTFAGYNYFERNSDKVAYLEKNKIILK